MIEIPLHGRWQISSSDGNFALIGEVPGTVFQALEAAGHWGSRNVFYRRNNRDCIEIADREFIFRRSFTLPSEIFAAPQRLYLEADGLDTLAEVRLNGRHIASTDNMFQRYRFEVGKYLQPGENHIDITFANAIAEISRRQQHQPRWNDLQALDGAVHLRKSHCSFGWDWRPAIPDIGIWRPLHLAVYAGGRLADVRVQQQHERGRAVLHVEVNTESWIDATPHFRVSLHDPAGIQVAAASGESVDFALQIEAPQLWWPHGYGDQPLYSLVLEMLFDGQVVDRRELTIGLRTVHLRRQPDATGESFEFVVNGVAIFARGANLVPEDVFLGRTTRATTERLIDDAVAANFNCLRIWGGGVYASDDLLDMCDRRGLLVWHDFMFACGQYAIGDPDFRRTIEAEVRDNLRRMRHHACLALLCGNNEMEWAFIAWDIPKSDALREEYLQLYERLLPMLVAEECPEIDYWPASPSSGGGFDAPNAPERGDVHDWEVWHGQKPFDFYRRQVPRFLSEFGFQSFPAPATVASFTIAEDRHLFSPVMEDHQRSPIGNQRLRDYLDRYFRPAKDFWSLLLQTQMLQAEAVRIAVEHLRRHRGRCMGALYWQLNDAWPAASWSSIDCFGRWKALHYAARRFFAPLLLSCEEHATGATLHLSNETNVEVKGTVAWALRRFTGEIVQHGEANAMVGPLATQQVAELDLTTALAGNGARELYLGFALRDDSAGIVRHGTAVFAPYRELHLPVPRLRWRLAATRDGWQIHIDSDAFAKFVRLELPDPNAIFSDNFFDLEPGQSRIIRIDSPAVDRETAQRLQVSSLVDCHD